MPIDATQKVFQSAQPHGGLHRAPTKRGEEAAGDGAGLGVVIYYCL
jgi:hypothetical protein